MHQQHVQPMKSTESENKFQVEILKLIFLHAHRKKCELIDPKIKLNAQNDEGKTQKNNMPTSMKTPPKIHISRRKHYHMSDTKQVYTNIVIATEC